MVKLGATAPQALQPKCAGSNVFRFPPFVKWDCEAGGQNLCDLSCCGCGGGECGLSAFVGGAGEKSSTDPDDLWL